LYKNFPEIRIPIHVLGFGNIFGKLWLFLLPNPVLRNFCSPFAKAENSFTGGRTIGK